MRSSSVRMLGAATVLALLALADAAPAAAQWRRDDRDRHDRRPAAQRPTDARVSYLTVGWQRRDLEELNDALVGAGYPAFEEDALTVGGGAYTTRRGLLIGGEVQGFLVPSETTDDDEFRTRLMGGYAMLRLGTAAPVAASVAVVPTVGIGVGGSTLSIQERDAVSFDDVLTDPRRGVRLTQASLVLDASLGLEYRFRASRPGRGGLLVGVTAGYTATPTSSEWSIDDGGDVSGGPDAGIDGFYVRGTIGGWKPRLPRR